LQEYILDVSSEECPRPLNLIMDELTKLPNGSILKALFSSKDCLVSIKMVLDSLGFKTALESSDKGFILVVERSMDPNKLYEDEICPCPCREQ